MKEAAPKELLKFPTKLAIKAMGYNIYDFDAHVVQIVRQFVPDIPESDISSRESRQGKYLAVTVKVTVKTREQADDIYRALSSDERILMAI